MKSAKWMFSQKFKIAKYTLNWFLIQIRMNKKNLPHSLNIPTRLRVFVGNVNQEVGITAETWGIETLGSKGGSAKMTALDLSMLLKLYTNFWSVNNNELRWSKSFSQVKLGRPKQNGNSFPFWKMLYPRNCQTRIGFHATKFSYYTSRRRLGTVVSIFN